MTEKVQYGAELRSDLVRELADIHASLKVLSAGQEEICRRIDNDVKSRLDKVNGSIQGRRQNLDFGVGPARYEGA